VACCPACTSEDRAWNWLASEDPEDDPPEVVVGDAAVVVVFLVDEFVELLQALSTPPTTRSPMSPATPIVVRGAREDEGSAGTVGSLLFGACG
jgi:hypothetical protein